MNTPDVYELALPHLELMAELGITFGTRRSSSIAAPRAVICCGPAYAVPTVSSGVWHVITQKYRYALPGHSVPEVLEYLAYRAKLEARRLRALLAVARCDEYTPDRDSGDDNDCALVALQRVADMTHAEAGAYWQRHAGRKRKCGTFTRKGFTNAGFRAGKYRITGIKLDGPAPTLLKVARTFPRGRYFLRVKGHALALVDGVIYDPADSGLRRRVLDIYRFEENDVDMLRRHLLKDRQV